MDEQTSLPGSISYHPITIRILIGLIRRHGPQTLFLCFTKQGSLQHVTETRWTFELCYGESLLSTIWTFRAREAIWIFRGNALAAALSTNLQSRCSDHCTVCLRLCIASHGAFSEVASAMQVPHDAENKPSVQDVLSSGELLSRPLLRVLVGNILLRHLTCAVAAFGSALSACSHLHCIGLNGYFYL